MSYPFSCLIVSPVSFPFLIFFISFPETQQLAGRSMGTRGRLLLVPTNCHGVLGYQWWPDPRDLLRSWALTKTYSLLVLICRVGGRTCEIPCGLVHFQELCVWRESGWTFTCSGVTPALLSLEICGVVPSTTIISFKFTVLHIGAKLQSYMGA